MSVAEEEEGGPECSFIWIPYAKLVCVYVALLLLFMGFANEMAAVCYLLNQEGKFFVLAFEEK